MTDATYDFASRDYTNIRQDLARRAENRVPEWVDRDPSDFGSALVDLWAYMGDILHFYIDRAANEAFLSTAGQKESVLAYANLFDYTPLSANPSTGYVYVSNTGSASVSLPAGTMFYGVVDDTPYMFHSLSTAIINVDETAAISVRQGTYTTEEVLTSSSDGTIGQRYTLSQKNVYNDSVQVFVYEDGVTKTEWDRVLNVNNLPVNSAGFSLYKNANEEMEVVFGNRYNGRIPPVGSKVTSTYVTCAGSAGNLAANKVVGFYQTPAVGLNVTGSTAMTGGSDSETIDSIKRSVRAAIKTQYRAVTLDDYVQSALSISGVYKAVASFTGSTVTIHAIPYISNFYSYTGSSASVSLEVQDTIEANLAEVSMLGISVTAASSVTVNKANLTATIYVNDRYIANTVKTAVEDALNNLFTIENVDFGKEVRIGDIYKTAMSVDGVDYITVSTYEMRTPANALISAGALPAIEILRKGTFTLTTSGGVTTA